MEEYRPELGEENVVPFTFSICCQKPQQCSQGTSVTFRFHIWKLEPGLALVQVMCGVCVRVCASVCVHACVCDIDQLPRLEPAFVLFYSGIKILWKPGYKQVTVNFLENNVISLLISVRRDNVISLLISVRRDRGVTLVHPSVLGLELT